MKKSIPKIREREGNEKKAFPKFGNRKGMKKSIPIIRERESEAFILGNGRERELPLTPDPNSKRVQNQTVKVAQAILQRDLIWCKVFNSIQWSLKISDIMRK